MSYKVHEKCYSSTCFANRSTTQVAATNTTEPDVYRLEITFFYPFALTTHGKQQALQLNTESIVDDAGAAVSFDLIFGDDGHLNFKDCMKTIPILPDPGGLSASTTFSSNSTSRVGNNLAKRPSYLRRLKDKHNNFFYLHDVFIRLFSFNTGMLRFVISAEASVSVQTVLNLQNSVMRLDDNKAGRLQIVNDDGISSGNFEPKQFVSQILTEKLGSEITHWVADEHTDRLFVFTLAAIGGLISSKDVLSTAYHIGQMEWSVDEVSNEQLDIFKTTSCHLRFAQATSGLWSTYHRDGGSIIYFGDQRSIPRLPIFAIDRRKKQTDTICGTKRPLSLFSMSEFLLFQRTFLRNLDGKMNKLIQKETKHDRDSLAVLHDVHSDLLKFRARFGSSPVSKSSAAQEQVTQWSMIAGVNNMNDVLVNSIADLRAFLAELHSEHQQQRLDIISIVLGFLATAQIVIDINSSYQTYKYGDGSQAEQLLIFSGISMGIAITIAAILIYIRLQS